MLLVAEDDLTIKTKNITVELAHLHSASPELGDSSVLVMPSANTITSLIIDTSSGGMI